MPNLHNPPKEYPLPERWTKPSTLKNSFVGNFGRRVSLRVATWWLMNAETRNHHPKYRCYNYAFWRCYFMKKVAIVQSKYIPWKGYFDLIASVHEFILNSDVHYTRRDWRNRNKVKTPQGLHWLTVPVQVKGKYHKKIRNTKFADPILGCRGIYALACNYCSNVPNICRNNNCQCNRRECNL